MSSLKRIDTQIAECTKNLEDLRVLRLDILKQCNLRCGKCEILSTLSKWTFRQAIWYVPPLGCTEGDYWKDDDSQSSFICPHCKQAHRIHDQSANLQALILDARALMERGDEIKI